MSWVACSFYWCILLVPFSGMSEIAAVAEALFGYWGELHTQPS
jgi:hypothetical protein